MYIWRVRRMRALHAARDVGSIVEAAKSKRIDEVPCIPARTMTCPLTLMRIQTFTALAETPAIIHEYFAYFCQIHI